MIYGTKSRIFSTDTSRIRDHSLARGVHFSTVAAHADPKQIKRRDPHMIHRRAFLGLLAAAPFAAGPAFAASPDIFATDGVAINGYDPVAYFTTGGPVQGDPAHTIMWHGAVWQFSSPETMAAFEMDPTAYAPQYGGYCAYAMAQGAIATTVPEAWTIDQGRLYLNFSTGVRTIWTQDIPGYVSRANGYWPDILAG